MAVTAIVVITLQCDNSPCRTTEQIPLAPGVEFPTVAARRVLMRGWTAAPGNMNHGGPGRQGGGIYCPTCSSIERKLKEFMSYGVQNAR